MPVQARSTVTVEAILQATVQVLLERGKERLTTTQVAYRAGVSVGTLYQYFPNKSALLQATLRRHMESVGSSVQAACQQSRGKGLLEMGTAIVFAYLDAKMRRVKESAALYSVSSDVDGAEIAKAAGVLVHRAVSELFATAREGLRQDAEVVATMVLAVLNGTARRLLETASPDRELVPLREQLIVLVHAYLRTCAAGPLAGDPVSDQ